MHLKIDDNWFVSNRICMPVKKVLGVIYEQEYVSTGAVFQYLTKSDIVFLYILYQQHIEEMKVGVKSGVNVSDYFAIHNIAVLLTAFLVGEGYSVVELDTIHKAKEKLGMILSLEATGILNFRDFKSYTLKRTNYNLTEDKPLKFVEIEKKDEA